MRIQKDRTALRMPTIAEMRNPKLAKFGDLGMSRPQRRRQIKLERKIYNLAANKGTVNSLGIGMVHEKKYVPMNCAMCGEHMKDIHDTHNPYPVADFIYAKRSNETDVADRCCTSCDEKVVIPARVDLYRKDKSNENKRFVLHADMIVRPNSTMHLRNPIPSVIDDILTIVHPIAE